MNRRNSAFDFLKVFLIFIVVVHHSGLLSGILLRGYMAVEFFFILSGYLLARTRRAYPEMTTAQYLRRRLRALYPSYLFAYACMLLVALCLGKLSYSKPWSPLLEILLLQNVGLPGSGGINYPLWYLSVLMTAGPILFFLHRKLSASAMRRLSLLVIAAAYIPMIASGTIEHWDNVLFVLSPTFWRGMADLMLGALLFSFEGTDVHKALAPCAGPLETGAFALFLLLLVLPGQLDFLCLAAILLLMLALTYDAPRLARPGKTRLCQFFLRHEYAIFLHHAMWIDLTRALCFVLHWPAPAIVPMQLIGLPLFAALSDRLVEGVMRRFRRRPA